MDYVLGSPYKDTSTNVCYQLPDGVLYDLQPISDDALGVILHQILATLARFQLHKQTTPSVWLPR